MGAWALGEGGDLPPVSAGGGVLGDGGGGLLALGEDDRARDAEHCGEPEDGGAEERVDEGQQSGEEPQGGVAAEDDADREDGVQPGCQRATMTMPSRSLDS